MLQRSRIHHIILIRKAFFWNHVICLLPTVWVKFCDSQTPSWNRFQRFLTLLFLYFADSKTIPPYLSESRFPLAAQHFLEEGKMSPSPLFVACPLFTVQSLIKELATMKSSILVISLQARSFQDSFIFDLDVTQFWGAPKTFTNWIIPFGGCHNVPRYIFIIKTLDCYDVLFLRALTFPKVANALQHSSLS